MRPTVLLFDIDGTLVTTGGAGRQALLRAFELRYGHPEACNFPFDGMTDRGIARAGLRDIGVEPTDAEIEALLATYVAHLATAVAQVEDSAYRLHRGMGEAVELALRQEGVAVGLGTGNIREGARVKLERVGIYDRFRFGGFGCDHEDRTELIRAGARRGAEQLGVPLPECRVVVIGDTPKDVAAAKGIGAECIGVGTGHFTPAQLKACGAEYAFPDLGSDEAVSALLRGL